MAILAGVGLEAARHHSDEVIRGIIFILVGIVVLIPGGEFLTNLTTVILEIFIGILIFVGAWCLL